MKWEYQALVLTHPGSSLPSWARGSIIHPHQLRDQKPMAHSSSFHLGRNTFTPKTQKTTEGTCQHPPPSRPYSPPRMRTDPRAMCRVTTPSAACLSEYALILGFLRQLLSGAALTSQVANKCACERETTGLYIRLHSPTLALLTKVNI